MKKSLLTLTALLVTFTLCACTAASSGNSSSQQEQSTKNQSSSTSEDETKSVDYEMTTYTNDGKVDGGYTYTSTLKIGPWVKASDTETINNIWKKIGGSGNVPDIDNFTLNKWSYGIHFSSQTSIMAFGTMSVTDTTQGSFSISDTSNQLSLGITSSELTSNLTCDSYVGFTNGGEYLHSLNSRSNYIVQMNPKMNSKTWGTVPFVVCVNEAISPEYPNGKPDAMDAIWNFGTNEFTVKCGW